MGACVGDEPSSSTYVDGGPQAGEEGGKCLASAAATAFNLYWAVHGDGTTTGAIMYKPLTALDSAPAIELASGPGPNIISSDANCIYWANPNTSPGTIYKVAKP